MKRSWLFPPTCPDELFTDREEELELLWRMGLEAAQRWSMSTALIGLRRLGKTELFRRVHDRLFYQQDQVVPIYFTFQGKNLNSKALAEDYFRNFLQQYLSFTDGKSQEYFGPGRGLKSLLASGLARGLAELTRLIESFRVYSAEGYEDGMLDVAITAPRLVAQTHEQPMIVFLDEFEEVIKVRNSNGTNPNALGKYQMAVESVWCPHIITGSSMTLILKDIVGRGPLFSRFHLEYIRGMPVIYAADLARKLAAFHKLEISEEMAVHLGERTGGNPFYIWAVVGQARRQGIDLHTPAELNLAIATDLIKGAIYSELLQQVLKFIHEQNRWGFGKQLVYYLAELGDDERLNTDHMAAFARQSGVDVAQVREAFVALARADLIEEIAWGMLYGRVRDPILNEFIREWTKMEREGKSQDQALDEKLLEYQERQKKVDEYKGYVAERMIELLMLKWRDETVAGRDYFGQDKEVILPQFTWVDQRKVKPAHGPEMQIDVVGRRMTTVWFVESKYWKGRKVGLPEIKEFETRCDLARQAMERVEETVLWYFSKDGFTDEALAYAREKGILLSDEAMLNALLARYGVRQLPKM